ncbi:MAG: BMP family protein [Oscillospiraceae bacterium]
MSKKLRNLVALLLVTVFVVGCLAGCGDKPAKEDEGATDVKKMKVALVLPGKKDDISFNQAMYRGMTSYAEEHKDEIELKIVENVYEVADIEPALTDFADQGYDVIFGHGFQFMEPIVTVAKKYPEASFLLGTGFKFEKNSAIYDVDLGSGGYLMGVIAALASETGKVGVIGGADASEIFRGHEGFKLGAKTVNPDIDIQEVYTGDWTDTAGAYEAAVGMYDSGVDVIWHSGDGIGLGVVQAAVEKDKYVLGNVEDQVSLGEKNVLSGLQYQWEAVIAQIFEDIKSGSFQTLTDEQRIYWINIANGGLTYTALNDAKGTLTPEEVKTIEDTFAQLKAGSIEIPEFKQ